MMVFKKCILPEMQLSHAGPGDPEMNRAGTCHQGTWRAREARLQTPDENVPQGMNIQLRELLGEKRPLRRSRKLAYDLGLEV